MNVGDKIPEILGIDQDGREIKASDFRGRKIVTLTGSSPASFILNIKMKRARHLLETDPKMSIDDIAFCCGFEHTSSFYHAFRKKYGVTPRDVRRGIE